jgi:hypothetical protein
MVLNLIVTGLLSSNKQLSSLLLFTLQMFGVLSSKIFRIPGQYILRTPLPLGVIEIEVQDNLVIIQIIMRKK